MAKDVASVVICEECGEHVAEVVGDAKRALCSECHLMESGTRSRREKKTGPED
jgi:formylmethanofuran dehydrogenase subunit E